jgi:hypothetical protein
MNLSNFETEINPVIMGRGVIYFVDGLVDELEEAQTGFWQATIEGTELYDVEIVLNKDSIRQWFCTCPYDGPICKHVAATLLGIRECNNINTKTATKTTVKKPSQPTKQTQLDNVLQKIEREELVNYLRQLISADKTLLNKTLRHFQNYTGKEVTAPNYVSQFNAIIKKHSSRGFIDYRSARGFTKETHELIETLEAPHISAKVCVDSCFEILTCMMKKVANAIDDSSGDLAEISDHLANMLENTYPQLTAEQQQYCFKQVLFWIFQSDLSDYGLDQYFDYLPPLWAKNNPDFREQYLQALDNVVIDPDNSWREEEINKKKYDLFLDWGKKDEAEKFALGKIEIPYFRKIFVDKAIKNKDFETARSLINTGIKLATKRKHPGVVSDWRETLLSIAKMTNDVDSIRQEIMKLMDDSWFEIKRYRQLKASYQADEWQKVQAEYAKKITARYNDSIVQAEIYAEENQLRELFDIIQKDEYRASSLFKKYLKILSKEFPEESANFYAIIIHEELKQTDRKVYEQAVRDIKALQKIPMGKAIAKQLIKEATAQYKNRPTMLRIFESSFGEIN